MTSDEWWGEVERHWPDLISIVANWHPARPAKPFDAMRITAPRAEQARKAAEEEIKREYQKDDVMNSVGEPDPVWEAEQAKSTRDVSGLARLLNGTWMGVPESTECWGIPGFGVLCDLLGDMPEEAA